MLVDIAIPRTKFNFLTYQAPDDLMPGDLVSVPLRDKSRFGIVTATNSASTVKGIKDIEDVIERKFLSSRMVKLYQWIAEYYLATMGEVLRLALPSKIRKGSMIPEITKRHRDIVKSPDPTYAQGQAIKKITTALRDGGYQTFLLYGITGSGKTEVYIRCIEETIENLGRALILVPEISMTPLLYERLRERFGDDVVTIHSSLTEKERNSLWLAIKRGNYRVIIGPRSAVLVPIPDLKLIIVDEEHDQSYKEHERAPRYHARDVAVVRAKIENCVAVLGSATPQVESYYNAGTGKYQMLMLKERIEARPLPEVEIIDLKTEHRRFVSKKLIDDIDRTISRDEQIILFLNRRGFAPSLLCPNCGFLARCPYCHLPLVYHKSEKKEDAALTCHICHYRTRLISICPKCRRGTLLYRGAGTQRIEELVGKIVKHKDRTKEVPILRLDRDVARKKGQAERVLKTFESGRAKILLGTQLVTKGLDFPDVTLVGIVNADILLNFPDFRNNERTFQILTQVAGRSGRGEKIGRVVLQTYYPDQYSNLFSYLQDYPRFYAQEIELRRALNFPPFCRLILIRLKGTDETTVWREARRIFAVLDKIKEAKTFGPNRSFYYKIRNNFRVFCLMKVPKGFPHHKLRFLASHKMKDCQLDIDVDPLEVF